MPKYAQIETRTAPLSGEFGLNYATRLFGAEALTDLPRYERGKNKGQIKAFLRWSRATSPGWCRECQGPVTVGGLVQAWISAAPLGLRSQALSGQWLGRVQPLAGSRSVLGEEFRKAEARRQEADAAARSDDIAEERLAAFRRRLAQTQWKVIDTQPQAEIRPGVVLPIVFTADTEEACVSWIGHHGDPVKRHAGLYHIDPPAEKRD